MFVPSEDDPDVMADVCLLCNTVLGVVIPGDPELEEIGDSLGDPEGDEWDRFYVEG